MNPKPPAILELRRACRVYGAGQTAVAALRDVDLIVSAAEQVAIDGPSGSGKSTCLNILGFLDVPTSGIARIDGHDIASASPHERARIRRDAIGFVFQSPQLIAGMTALANVELPLVYRRIPGAERRRRAREALAMVGLADRATHQPQQLSGGQQQRVAIARAMVGQPRILIADEPTAALDTRTGETILALLTALNQRSGVAVVIVTHDQAIAAAAPRIVTLRDGRIISDVAAGGLADVA